VIGAPVQHSTPCFGRRPRSYQLRLCSQSNTAFDNGAIVEVSFGAARQQLRFFTSVTKLLTSHDEAFQKLAAVLSAILAAPGVS
jgi:hypothetical protein